MSTKQRYADWPAKDNMNRRLKTGFKLPVSGPDPNTVVEWAWNDIGDISDGNFVYNDAESW